VCICILQTHNQTFNETNNETNSWADNPVDLGDTYPHLDADYALGNFSRFVYNNGYIFSEFDHVMAMTGYDIAYIS